LTCRTSQLCGVQSGQRAGHKRFREGDPAAAQPQLIRAAKVDPMSAEAHAFLADAYQQLGQAQNTSRERAKAAQLKTQAPE